MCYVFFFFKQKTAYEMRISDWSSDVCSSDLRRFAHRLQKKAYPRQPFALARHLVHQVDIAGLMPLQPRRHIKQWLTQEVALDQDQRDQHPPNAAIAVGKGMDRLELIMRQRRIDQRRDAAPIHPIDEFGQRSEE